MDYPKSNNAFGVNVFIEYICIELVRCLFVKQRKRQTMRLKDGIPDMKIGQKRGNPFTDFLRYTGNFKRYFSVYSNRCTQTKVSDKVFRLY